MWAKNHKREMEESPTVGIAGVPAPDVDVTQPILLVDDDPHALAFLKHVLQKYGYSAQTARSGAEALAKLRQEPYRIVISDWEMGEVSGLDLCRALRTGNHDHYVYVVLLTAKSDYESRVEAYASGVDDFLGKPIRPAELIGHVRVAERVISLESADTTIFALAKLAESRDQDTGRHLERVQRYTRVLATTAMNRGLYPEELNASFVRLLYETSPLHDIGKVAIPDAVLLKRGKLTAEEFEIMKSHTTRGAATLAAALERRPGARFLQVAQEIALSHHEKWNGGGYPQGRRGDEIPLAARIVAVADVFDALSVKRVYKPAFPTREVCEMILQGRGEHFDPALVDVFEDCREEFLGIARALAEKDEEQKPAGESEEGEAGPILPMQNLKSDSSLAA